jgi:diaminopropionate ammonia-lyase
MSNLTEVEYIVNENAKEVDTEKASVDFMNGEIAKKVRDFHKSFPEYKVTPLHRLDKLAKQLGVSDIWVKDESYRFGLNAFKVLGGSFAIGKYLAEKLNVDISNLSFEKLRSKEVKEMLGEITFVTATDGNHGRGIAWAANQLGQKSVVYMPKGSSEIRLNNIRKEGSEASITDLN